MSNLSEEAEVLERLKRATIERDEEDLMDTAKDVIDASINPQVAIEDGIQEGLRIIGDKFEKGELFLPELVVAGDAAQPAIDLLIKNVPKEDRKTKGKIVIGTGCGDIHDIGKNIVAALLRSQGYTVHDLGSDVPTKKFVKKAEEVDADIIAMSTLLSSSMIYQRDVLEELEDRGLNDKFLIIGGAASNPDWAEECGVAGYGRTVDDAIELCDTLIREGKEIERPLIVE